MRDNRHVTRNLNQMEEVTPQLVEGRLFQAERTACARALGLEGAWLFGDPQRRPMQLEVATKTAVTLTPRGSAGFMSEVSQVGDNRERWRL